MAIQITRLSFTNYRQYGTGALSLIPAAGVASQLFAFVAPNGTGKTTLLRMIIWCLYGEETPGSTARQNTQKLPIANIKKLNEATANEKVPVSVSVRFSIDGNTVEFIRSTACIAKGNGQFVESASQLTAVATPLKGNSKTVHGVQADVLVKQYFDKAIYNFYFFDGEKLSDFFNTPLKDSIYNIAQVNLLENTVNHTEKLKSDMNRKLGRDVPDLEVKQKELDTKRKNLEGAKEELALETAQGQQFEKTVKALNDALRGYEPVKKIQAERNRLYGEKKELEKKYDDFQKAECAFVREYTVLLYLYPRIKALHDYIETESANGKLPPSIDRDQIERLLQHPEEPCPVCGSHLSQDICDHLRELLKEYDISSKTANLFSSYRSPLEELLQKAKGYPVAKETLLNQGREISLRLQQNEIELAEKDRSIAQYGGEAGGEKFTELNMQFEKARRELQNHYKQIGRLEIQIKDYETELNRLGKEIEKLNREADIKKEYKEKFRVLCELSNAFKTVKDHIVNETKERMQTLTWKFFSAMIWKTNTFGKVAIDDKYNVTVYSVDGRPMTNSMSETEKMALAYSFTLAVHDISGKNCPLVIDSPLGRVSDENRKRMAQSLLDVARDKQIIMLFTPDEYSPDVAALYDHAATVQRLQLSADESCVEGVE